MNDSNQAFVDDESKNELSNELGLASDEAIYFPDSRRLQPIDVANLFLQFRDDPRAWRGNHGNGGHESLMRCQRLGYCFGHTVSLTEKGRAVVLRTQQYVDRMRQGIPLEARQTTAIEGLQSLQWYVAEVQIGKESYKILATRKGFVFVVRHNETIGSFKAIKCNSEQAETLTAIIPRDGIDKRIALDELTPIAYQVHDWPMPTEVICLRSQDGSRVVRIGAAYYDFVADRYKRVTFLQNPKRSNGPVIVKNTTGAGIRGISAIIMPVNSDGWPKLSI